MDTNTVKQVIVAYISKNLRNFKPIERRVIKSFVFTKGTITIQCPDLSFVFTLKGYKNDPYYFQ